MERIQYYSEDVTELPIILLRSEREASRSLLVAVDLSSHMAFILAPGYALQYECTDGRIFRITNHGESKAHHFMQLVPQLDDTS